MAQVLGVEFKTYGELHYLIAAADEKVGDVVRYPTQAGYEIAKVVWRGETTLEGIPQSGGLADEADLARDRHNRQYRASARKKAKELIAELGLPMRIVAVDLVDSHPNGQRQFVVYFSSPSRVDFRALVPKLAAAVDARIDLRQVGARDVARVTGGIGVCGLKLCCASRLECQGPANPQCHVNGPATGSCGRLLCCLRYEKP